MSRMQAAGEGVVAWCTGARVLQSLALLMVGASAIFRFGPYLKLKTLTGGAVFPEEEITQPEGMQRFLTDAGEAGRALYAQSQLWDVLNATLIGVFALVLVAWVVGRSTEAPTRSLLLLIPLVGPVADLAENGVIAASLAAFPGVSPVVALLPVVSTVKFGGLAGTLFFVIILGGRGLAARAMSGTKS